MLGLFWTHKTARAGLAFLSLCLLISHFPLELFNSVFSAQDYSYLTFSWLIPTNFSSSKPEKAFLETAILCCYWQQMPFLPRISVTPFVSFRIFFLSARVFFVLLVSFPVWYPILTFFSLQNYPSLTSSFICTFLLPLLISHFSPGVSQPLSFSESPPLSQFYSLQCPLPSGMQLYLLLCQQILGGADQPKHPLLVTGAAGGNALSSNFLKIEKTYHVWYKIHYITQ